MASMTEADQTAMMVALQKELAEMKKAHEEAAKKNREEIKNLQEENRRMKKLVEGVPSLAMTNQAGKSYATGAGLQAEKEMKNDFTLEMDGESHPSKTTNTTGMAGPDRCHPFTDHIMDTPLPDKWKGFNRDRYDGTTDPDEHVDAYTTHMSLYNTIACVCSLQPISMILDAERRNSCSSKNSASSGTTTGLRQVEKRRRTRNDKEGPGLAGTKKGTTEDPASPTTHL